MDFSFFNSPVVEWVSKLKLWNLANWALRKNLLQDYLSTLFRYSLDFIPNLNRLSFVGKS
jgi:hypothetical protein